MSKKRKTILITSIIIIFLFFIGTVAYINIKEIDKLYTQDLNEEILYIMSNSDVIKETLGEVSNVFKKESDWFEDYDENGSIFVKYEVTLLDNKKKTVLIILNFKYTKGIYAYEIDKKVYYEEINDKNIITTGFFVEV